MATYARFTPNDSGQRLHPTYYRGCWHVVSRSFLWRYRQSTRLFTGEPSSLLKGVYNPKAVFPHAALLRHACAHCPIFPTAASRRSLGRVSVPVWLIILSDQLPIVALVGHYPTNKLIGRRLLSRRLAPLTLRYHAVLAIVSHGCPPPGDRFLRVTPPSATDRLPCPCDLHVLSMPPAFALSQDQTLRFIFASVLRHRR